MNIFGVFKQLGIQTIPESFYSAIDDWKSWYDGEVKGFHRYTAHNGQAYVRCRRYTMGMAKKVAEDWADLLLNEKVVVTLEGEREQAWVDEVFRENNFAVKANEMQEIKAALGTAAYVLRLEGAEVNPETGQVIRGGNVKIDYVSAPYIYPISWENGIVKECAFSSVKQTATGQYLYLQIHRVGDRGTYVITNKVFAIQNENLKEVEEIREIPGFETVQDEVETGSDKPQFVVDRLNIVNNADCSNPMGIPAFANAIDQLKGVDYAYDSYVNEFVLGKKKIVVQPGATKTLDGEPAFDPNDLTFFILPEDGGNDNLVKEIDMTLRAQEHKTGIQDMLNALSSKCGLGENRYRFETGSVKTATEVISENSPMFRTVRKHEIILEGVLKELCRIILRIGNTAFGAGLDENVEISVDFDDSIIVDKDTERARDRADVAAGLMNAYEYRMKWYNEDEATAKAALPGMGDVL